MTNLGFRITRQDVVVFDSGYSWENIPIVTGNDLRRFRVTLGRSQKTFAPLLGLASKGSVSDLEKWGDEPINSKIVRVKFLLLKEANPDPDLFWEAEKVIVKIDQIAGYFRPHVCGVGPVENLGRVTPLKGSCGETYFSTYQQRVFCHTCHPYEGKGKK